jgi:hypothetical protein
MARRTLELQGRPGGNQRPQQPSPEEGSASP